MKASLDTIFTVKTRNRVLRFKNTILDCGLDMIASRGFGGVSDFCNLGRSNYKVKASQTGLLEHAGSAASGSELTGFDEGYFFIKKRYVFSGITGSIREIGLSALENAEYFNRQVFSDENEPVTITVEQGEDITILAELRLYIPGVNTWIQIAEKDGVTISQMFQASEAWLNFPKSSFTGADYHIPYVHGKFHLEAVYTVAGEDILQEISYTRDNPLQIAVSDAARLAGDPAIIKEARKELKITFKWKWGRYVA